MPEDAPYAGDTSEARFMTNGTGTTAPQKRKLPPLNLENAYKTLNFYMEKPQYLANPFTSQAANDHLAAASKIVGINIQLERLNSQAETARARNSMEKQVGNSLLKLAESGPDGAKIASRWYASDENGTPLYQNPANWSAILSDYQATTPAKPLSPIGRTLADKKAFLAGGGTEKEWDDEVESRIRTGAAPIDVKLIEAAKQYRDMGDTASADKLDAIVAEKARMKGASNDRTVTVTTEKDGRKISQRMTPAEADAIPDKETSEMLTVYAEEKAALNSGDKAKGPDWLGLSNRAQHLQELKIKLEQKGFDADTGKRIGSPAASTSTNAPAANVTKEQYDALKSGDLYWWNGKQIPKK